MLNIQAEVIHIFGSGILYGLRMTGCQRPNITVAPSRALTIFPS